MTYEETRVKCLAGISPRRKFAGIRVFHFYFYFPAEGAAVEFAFGLRNPKSEFERDVFKCLLAPDAGHNLHRLILVCKPGGESKLSAPAAKAIRDWVSRRYGLEVEVFELLPEAEDPVSLRARDSDFSMDFESVQEELRKRGKL